jgi:hypothetical protein
MLAMQHLRTGWSSTVATVLTDQLQTGGIPSEAYQYYKGKVYTLQEAARLREIDRIEEQEYKDIEASANDFIEKEVEEANPVNLQEYREKITEVSRELAAIQDARRVLEVDASLKRLEAERLREQEKAMKAALVRLKKEEEELSIVMMMLLL